MKIQFLGAAETVTGSRFLLTTQDHKVLIDCGLFQGYKELRLKNWEPFPVPPGSLDAVVLTHAHIDHSGYLPLLVRQGFRGPIYATSATRDLAEILLRDSGRIQEEDARLANKYGFSKHKPALPLYTEEDAIETLKQFRDIGFGKEHALGDELSFHASRAGHILGSAILSFHYHRETIVFSGDLGRPYDPIIKPPATIDTADYLILESTYGDRLHSEENTEEKLGKIIRETAAKGGNVIIPSFAVGRTQTILYLLYQLKEKNQIPNLPIFLDSPMAQNATDILKHHLSEHKLSPSLCADVCKIAHYIRSTDESKKLQEKAYPMIIIAASGMVEGGRILHHIKRYGPEHHHTIVFTGFQAPMTRGDRILRGSREVKIHGKMVPMRARIEMLENLSCHADYAEMLKWLEGFSKMPRTVFLTHGELSASQPFKKRIEERFGWNVVIPKFNDSFDL